MLITARRACQTLSRDGVSTWSAARVLASGLAGEPVLTQSLVLYDEARVTELAQRPSLRWPDVEERCRPGLFVSRRGFPATASRQDRLAALTREWGSVSPWQWVAVDLQIRRHGSFPFLATVGGLVVLGADIVELKGRSELVLDRPGAWFEEWEGCWLPTGPGRPWVLHLGPLAPEKISV